MRYIAITTKTSLAYKTCYNILDISNSKKKQLCEIYY